MTRTATLVACALLGATTWAHATNTTLAVSKTLDICRADSTHWRYSGVVSVSNTGAYDTANFVLRDCIQSDASGAWTDAPGLCTSSFSIATTVSVPVVIPKGGTVTFGYSINGAPLAGSIRNSARTSITNYVGKAPTAFGPSATAPWTGGTPPSCQPAAGCTSTVGYWANKPGVVWPAPYLRTNSFYLSGQTWQAALTTPASASPGYYQLAKQTIAALLNDAKGAGVPAGVQQTLDKAVAWLGVNGPAACTAAGSCGLQKTWAAVLDQYNNGLYPGGPKHCN